jgi:hypothetical protein
MGARSHEPRPVARAVEQVGGDLEREARLAAAPRADEGDEARGRDELAEFSQLLCAPDEARELHREVVPQFGVVEALDGRELRFEARRFELEDHLGRLRSLRRCEPSSLSETPSLRRSRTKMAVASETRTCPPWPTAAMRAAL